ncbi:MAG: DUF4271 domain-containing protein [Prevotellaceae bacterium]|jgi:hypothetical protein|nr:DUF4271 domain-containing protein [Prevotellaceae bacterium]
MQDTIIYNNIKYDSTVFGATSLGYHGTAGMSLLSTPLPDRSEQYLKDAVAVGAMLVYLLVILFVVKRYILGMYTAVVNYRFALKQHEEGAGLLPKNAGFLTLFTILIFAIHFSMQMKIEENWRKIMLFAVFCAIFFMQTILIKLVGGIAKTRELFREIIFNRRCFLSIIGVLVCPSTLLALLYDNCLHPYFLGVSLILLATVLLLMQIRLLNVLAKAGISYLFCFLYLCALEFSPYLLLLIVF